MKKTASFFVCSITWSLELLEAELSLNRHNCWSNCFLLILIPGDYEIRLSLSIITGLLISLQKVVNSARPVHINPFSFQNNSRLKGSTAQQWTNSDFLDLDLVWDLEDRWDLAE